MSVAAPASAPRSRRAWPWALLGALATIAVADLEPNLVEEGMVLHVAQRLAAGEHLYRDVVFFSGPLPFEALALLFRLFGAEIAVGRSAMALLLGLASASAFRLARRAGAGALAAPAALLVALAPQALFPMFSMFYYTPIAFCLGLFAADLATRERPGLGAGIAAGLCAAGVALCKQTLGALFAPALVAAVLLAAALTLGFYSLRGDLAPLWDCLVATPLSLSESFRAPFVNFWPPGRLAPEVLPNKAVYFSSLYFLAYGLFTPERPFFVALFQLLYALPGLALLASLALALVRRGLPLAFWAHGAFLLAMTSNLFPRADWGHLVVALPAAGAQLLIVAGLVRRTEPRALKLGARTACALLLALALATTAWLRSEAGPANWGPRVPLKPVSAVYRIATLPRLIQYLRKRVAPGEAIFVARAEPLLYFATDTRNPTPYTGVLTVRQEEQQDRILAALPQVRYVVMSDTDQPLWTYYSDELPRVQAHLERFYRVARGYPQDDASWIVVLERGPDRGATRIDLIERWRAGEARPWLRDARGGATRADTEAPPRLVARQNQRPLPLRLGAYGGGIDFEIEVPERARFEAGVGFRGMVSLDDLHEHPKRSQMRLLIAPAADAASAASPEGAPDASLAATGIEGAVRRTGEPATSSAPRASASEPRWRELAHVAIDDGRRAGRRWTPLEADLSAWAGQRVRLRIELQTAHPVGRRDLSWLGSPRIFTPPPAAAADPSAALP